MIQPTGVLSNHVGPSEKFRRRLFAEYKVEEIVNLSALRFLLFSNSLSPSCIITMRKFPPDGEPISYVCPKPAHTSEDDYRIVIESSDQELVYLNEARDDTSIWSALMWGGRRDVTLIRLLREHPTMTSLQKEGRVECRQGVIRGTKRNKKQEQLVGMRLFNARRFPDAAFLYLDADPLPINNDPFAHRNRATGWLAFELPQMLIKQSWQARDKRFRSVIVRSSGKGVMCSGSYVSVHADDSAVLDAACLSYNSKVAVYYLLLTSGRFAFYRAKANEADLLEVPIPALRPDLLKGIAPFDFEEMDRRCFQALGLKESERILIEDLFEYTLQDFKGRTDSPGRKATTRTASGLECDSASCVEPELWAYAHTLLAVLKSGFGQNKNICATIYQDRLDTQLAVRLVALHLDWPDRDSVSVEQIDSEKLLATLVDLNDVLSERSGDILRRRVAMVHQHVVQNERAIPTFYIIKPDQTRYWLRSAAMRDADEITADILMMENPESQPNPNQIVAA